MRAATNRRSSVADTALPGSNSSPQISQQDVFDAIAPGWYGFRHRSIFTRELGLLAERWRGGRLLNLGCGHGPDFVPFAGRFELYGADFSAGMLELCRKYSQKHGFAASLSQADIRHLPYPDDFFDYAVAVAVIHHIDDAGERLKALVELKRVLKPGGEAFITAWNYWQPRFWFSRRDVFIPWRKGVEVLQRYYHLFSHGELVHLAGEARFMVMRSFPESSYHLPFWAFSRNIYLLAKKCA